MNTGINTSDVPMKQGKYHCPECRKGFRSKVTLGTHRRYRHGIMGMKLKGKKEVNSGRRVVVVRDEKTDRRLQPIAEPQSVSNQILTEDNNYGFIEFSAGYAVGHIKTWIDFYCQQTGGKLSPDEFTKRVASPLLGS